MLALLCFSCISFISMAEEPDEFDFDGLFNETLKTVENDNVNSGIFWIPQEFWAEIYSEKNGLSSANSELMKTAFEPYLIFMVSCSVKNGSRFKPLKEKDILAQIKLVDRKGVTYSALNRNQVNSSALSIANRLKSAFSRRMGKKGTIPVFFAAKNDNDKRIINTQREDSFKITLANETFQWKLPVAALAKPIKCSKCGKSLNGTYQFCPYDGTRLKK